MADFGKLNFQVAFNPATAFPIDARCYFEGENALSSAQAAAATAEDVGSKNTVYHYGMKLLVNQNGVYTWYEITTDKTLVKEGSGDGAEIDFATDEEVTKILDAIYGETGTDREDGSEDNTFTDEDFASDEEVGDMLDEVFGV